MEIIQRTVCILKFGLFFMTREALKLNDLKSVQDKRSLKGESKINPVFDMKLVLIWKGDIQ